MPATIRQGGGADPLPGAASFADTLMSWERKLIDLFPLHGQLSLWGAFLDGCGISESFTTPKKGKLVQPATHFTVTVEWEEKFRIVRDEIGERYDGPFTDAQYTLTNQDDSVIGSFMLCFVHRVASAKDITVVSPLGPWRTRKDGECIIVELPARYVDRYGIKKGSQLVVKVISDDFAHLATGELSVDRTSRHTYGNDDHSTIPGPIASLVPSFTGEDLAVMLDALSSHTLGDEAHEFLAPFISAV